VRRLCAKARQPVRADLLEALGMPGLTTGAVCVYHEMVPKPPVARWRARASRRRRLDRLSGGPVALPPAHAEIGESVKAGARGDRHRDLAPPCADRQNWQALYDEMREMRAACGEAHVKAILATGELGTLRNVARASLVCMMAGADFIKTSTGKEGVNATLPVSLTMIRAIRDYHGGPASRSATSPRAASPRPRTRWSTCR
jgi:deoxyribose-phosphate aldolase